MMRVRSTSSGKQVSVAVIPAANYILLKTPSVLELMARSCSTSRIVYLELQDGDHPKRFEKLDE